MNERLRDQLAAHLVDRYVLQDELRGGGMSRVFVALDTALDRRVVIKVLAPERAGALSAERFRSEALFAASLQHAHIVPILAAGAVDDIPYLIMPFVDGRSLRDRLDREGRLPLRDAVRILLDVARACAYAHERGIVHRDIKPDNVLMSGDAAMITDFGVARAIVAGGRIPADARLTREGFTVGSPRYMAPEQAVADPDIDHRADIYAFGVLAFELIAGEPPFTASSSAELLRAHLTIVPPDLRKLRSDTPLPLAELVNWCLAKRREDRPPHASDIVAALEAPGIASSAHTPRWVRIPARRPFAIGAAAVVVLLLAIAGTLWRRHNSLPLPARDSIAVLPVIDRTSDSASEWIATGLTDEVTAMLARATGLRVAARRTVESLRSDTASPQRLAHDLGVATVLDATLTRVDSNLYQVAAQLIDGRTGLVLWSASIRGSRSDALLMQDSVVAGVLGALGRTSNVVATTNALEDPAARRMAWSEYLQGREELRRRGPAHLRAAITHFAAALRSDAMLPQAYTGLADAWSLLPLYDPAAGQSATERALDAVDRALALDSKLPGARASRGHLLVGMWQWKEAETDLRAAITADSALVDAQQWLGELLLLTGRSAEAVKVLTAARTLDPTSPVLVAVQGFAAGLNGQYDTGLEAINVALRLDPSFADAYMFGGALQLCRGRAADAVVLLERGAALAPNDPLILGLLGQARARAGDTAGARGSLRQLNALPSGVPRDGARTHVELGLDDTTAAFAALDRAAADREPFFAAEPLGTPLFATIRGTSHFAALLDTLGFGPEAARAIRGIR